VKPRNSSRTSIASRAAPLLALLGLIPSGLFLFWIERHHALPRTWIDFDLPWLDLSTSSTATLCAWNALLLGVAFYFPHSLLARSRITDSLPTPLKRPLYVLAAGGGASLVMGFWQNTGVLVWALPFTPSGMLLASLFGFWLPLGLAAFLPPSRSWKRFLGLEPPLPNEVPLQTDGVYAWVRHPLYLGWIVALLLSPMMSLDRLLFAGVTVAYLAVAIPLEERDLLQRGGQAYREYRKRTPALLPGFKPLKRQS
jgi:protein-S-isoprenylcysteine O-methyltransferase Ste14